MQLLRAGRGPVQVVPDDCGAIALGRPEACGGGEEPRGVERAGVTTTLVLSRIARTSAAKASRCMWTDEVRHPVATLTLLRALAATGGSLDCRQVAGRVLGEQPARRIGSAIRVLPRAQFPLHERADFSMGRLHGGGADPGRSREAGAAVQPLPLVAGKAGNDCREVAHRATHQCNQMAGDRPCGTREFGKRGTVYIQGRRWSR